jgi:peptidoglycan-N-acetylglucosamine deacetylase
MKQAEISIVIPALNEAQLLPHCLRALMPQALACGAEVIVVDNGSLDQTAAVARRFGARVVVEPKRGYVYALNCGVQSARHPIIAVTDADTEVSPTWLAGIGRALHDERVAACTGPIWFDGCLACTLARYLVPRDLWGANMAFRRSVYDTVGGFDEQYNLSGDVMFGRSVRRRGKIRFVREQSVTTSGRRFQSEPLRQFWHYAKNFVSLFLVGRPVSWEFDCIRVSETHLRRVTRSRQLRISLCTFLGFFAYVLLWPQATLFGQIVVRPHVKAKMVALTFDDGPNGAATRHIVDILKEKKVPATFFVVGRSVDADPATAAYVAAGGFPVEIHSWDHAYNIPFQRPCRIRRELDATTHSIEAATGNTPDLFRPPHGWRSPQLLLITHREHLQVVNWSVDPMDYWTDDPDRIVNRVVHHIRPGSIVLLHDGLQDGPLARKLENREATIAALPVIIDRLRVEGYQFVTVDQLLAERSKERATSRLAGF